MTRLSNHEARKQQVDQCGRSGTYRDPANTSNQEIRRKGGRMKHHQDQDAPRSVISHIRDLRAKIPNVLKWQTRRVPTDDEVIQDRN